MTTFKNKLIEQLKKHNVSIISGGNSHKESVTIKFNEINKVIEYKNGKGLKKQLSKESCWKPIKKIIKLLDDKNIEIKEEYTIIKVYECYCTICGENVGKQDFKELMKRKHVVK